MFQIVRLDRLQALQNQAARIITKEKEIMIHITPTLIKLHWLPVKSRIKYKILLLVYKTIHGEGPLYLASLLEEYHPPRSLRSAAQSLLSEPRVHKNMVTVRFLWRDQSCGTDSPSKLEIVPAFSYSKKPSKLIFLKKLLSF